MIIVIAGRELGHLAPMWWLAREAAIAGHETAFFTNGEPYGGLWPWWSAAREEDLRLRIEHLPLRDASDISEQAEQAWAADISVMIGRPIRTSDQIFFDAALRACAFRQARWNLRPGNVRSVATSLRALWDRPVDGPLELEQPGHVVQWLGWEDGPSWRSIPYDDDEDPVQFVGPLVAPVLRGPRLLRERLIYVTCGSIDIWPGDVRAGILNACDRAVRKFGEAVVIVAPRATDGGIRSRQIVAQALSPLSEPYLIRRASLVVHHGGAHTFLQCCAGGVAQVIVPIDEGNDTQIQRELLLRHGLGCALNDRTLSGLEDIATEQIIHGGPPGAAAEDLAERFREQGGGLTGAAEVIRYVSSR
jgi:UDP:flavonoid glycosyltransferase YjiC (YdhE family)